MAKLQIWKRLKLTTCVFLLDSFTGLVNILTDIIWRFTGDFMGPDLVCRVVRYLQVCSTFQR